MRVTKLALLALGALFLGVSSSNAQTALIGPNQYAFQFTGDPDFGLFFNAASLQYEFRNNAAAPIFAFNANTGRMNTNLGFNPGADLTIGNDRYAFRSQSNPNFGLFFSAASLEYQFLDNAAVPVFAVGANTGNLRIGGNTGFGTPANSLNRVLAEDLGSNATPNQSVIRADRTGLVSAPGPLTSWISPDAAVRGFSDWGNAYSAAVYGSGVLDFENSAAVVGVYSGSTYGALCYNRGDAGIKAGFFSGDVEVTGKTSIGGSTVESDVQCQVEGGLFVPTNTGSLRLGFPDGGDGWALSTINGGEDLQFRSRPAAGDFDTKFRMTQDGNLEVNGGKIIVQESATDSVGIDLDVDPSEFSQANYYQSEAWVFGESNGSGEAISGDFVMARFGTQEYIHWISYFAPARNNENSLGINGQGWSEVFATNGTINTSDAREKKNIEELDYGMETLMKLKPVSYEWKDDVSNHGIKLGFIAQDLLEVVPEVVVTEKRVEDRETGEVTFEEAERMGVFYDDLIPVLTKAIQEQQGTIEELTEENEALMDKLDDVMDRMAQFEQDLQSCCFSSQSSQVGGSTATDKAELGQNIPNPFTESTIIQYYLPANAGNAIIRVTDMEGSPVEDIQLGAQQGANQVEFRTQSLSAGTYLYSLFVDGEFISTKKMVIAR